MANTLKIISALLSYPHKELLEAGDELQAALAQDPEINKKSKTLIRALIADITSSDIYDVQERYVQLFDRSRSNSLHLFEHVHGESRDRGQAMVDLATMYQTQGFEINAKELPDFLPLFLEYLSTQSAEEVHNLLGQTLHIISALRARMQKRQSIYANAFLALEQIAKTTPDKKAVAEILAVPEDDPDDLAALDAIWEEEAVSFGAGQGNDAFGQGACTPERLRTQIRAHNRPAPEPEINGEPKNV